MSINVNGAYKHPEHGIVKVLCLDMTGDISYISFKTLYGEGIIEPYASFCGTVVTSIVPYLYMGDREDIQCTIYHKNSDISIMAEYTAKSGEVVTLEIKSAKLSQRVIVAAAIKDGNGNIHVGSRHFSNIMRSNIKLTSSRVSNADNQGFIDQFDEWINREDALCIATLADQLNIRRKKVHPLWELFSEDLY